MGFPAQNFRILASFLLGQEVKYKQEMAFLAYNPLFSRYSGSFAENLFIFFLDNPSF